MLLAAPFFASRKRQLNEAEVPGACICFFPNGCTARPPDGALQRSLQMYIPYYFHKCSCCAALSLKGIGSDTEGL